MNAVDAATEQDDKHNSENTLTRHEFFQALVRIAVQRYVVTGEIRDVSDAIERCCEDMESNLAPEGLQRSDIFRARYCYNYQIHDVLEAHMTTLREPKAARL